MLVFLALALFLRFRLALWVSMGIPIAFLGAMWVVPAICCMVDSVDALELGRCVGDRETITQAHRGSG